MSLSLGVIPVNRKLDIYRAALSTLRDKYSEAVAARDRQRFVMFDLLVAAVSEDAFDVQMARMVVTENEVSYVDGLITAMQLKMLGLFSG
jgi:hypothetical protein